MRETKGITLIALVVTIVILLILSGITINLVFSENGIIAKAREAAERTNQSSINEQSELNEINDYMSNMLNEISNGSDTGDLDLPSDGSYSERKGVNTPNIKNSNLIPVKWSGDKWLKTTGDDPEWYSYSEKLYANAVLEGTFLEDGTLDESSSYSMFVWIPRYAYSITDMYHALGDMSTAGTIEVEFMKGTSNESATGRTTFQNASGQGNWNIHPAFNYGGEVSGIWVAKFEASQSDASSNTAEYGDYTGGTSGVLQVKAGVNSWRNITIGEMYSKSINYNTSLNSHLMKNDEWGAVAYLSRSEYGKTEEVYINNSSEYITGLSAAIATGTKGEGTSLSYSDSQGVKASTTGNVTGVYDMNGGSWEYVAAYIDNKSQSLTSYGNSLATGNAETKNAYALGEGDTQESNYNKIVEKYGDAIYETSNGYADANGSWYADYAYFPYGDFTFFARGGACDNSKEAGVFAFSYSNGDKVNFISFRPTLVVK